MHTYTCYIDYICVYKVSWSLGFYVLAISQVISGWLQICVSAHPWWLYSVASLGEQATSTMTSCPTQSHYSDTESTSPFPILMTPNSNKHQSISHCFDWNKVRSCRFESHNLPKWERYAQLARLSRLVICVGWPRLVQWTYACEKNSWTQNTKNEDFHSSACSPNTPFFPWL